VDKTQQSWICSYFGSSDYYGRAYTAMGLLGQKETNEELSGVLNLLQPKSGSHILDWCGGWGRHAVPLAKRGFKLTILDFSKDYLERAEAYAKKEGVNLDMVHADFRETPPDIQANYAVNLFTAGLGYLSESDDLAALRSLHAALKPKARIFIDTMSLFWIVRNWRDDNWVLSLDGTKRHLHKRVFDFWRNRTTDEGIFQDIATGSEENRSTEISFYSPAQLANVLRTAGFDPQELFGGFDGAPFTLDSKRLIMIAQKH